MEDKKLEEAKKEWDKINFHEGFEGKTLSKNAADLYTSKPSHLLYADGNKNEVIKDASLIKIDEKNYNLKLTYQTSNGEKDVEIPVNIDDLEEIYQEIIMENNE